MGVANTKAKWLQPLMLTAGTYHAGCCRLGVLCAHGGVTLPGDCVSLMAVADRNFVSQDPEELLHELARKYRQGGLQHGHGTRRYFNLHAIQRQLAIQLFSGLHKVEVQSLRFRYLSHETTISFITAVIQPVNDKILQVWVTRRCWNRGGNWLCDIQVRLPYNVASVLSTRLSRDNSMAIALLATCHTIMRLIAKLLVSSGDTVGESAPWLKHGSTLKVVTFLDHLGLTCGTESKLFKSHRFLQDLQLRHLLSTMQTAEEFISDEALLAHVHASFSEVCVLWLSC